MLRLVREDAEIEEVEGRCLEAEASNDSAYPGMTYEQGVLAALRWLTDPGAAPVFDD